MVSAVEPLLIMQLLQLVMIQKMVKIILSLEIHGALTGVKQVILDLLLTEQQLGKAFVVF